MKNTKFINVAGQTLEVVVHGEYAYPVGSGFKIQRYQLHDTKFDAMYEKFLHSLKRGKPYTNYKSSKYYKQYLERLKKDYPEYFI